MNKFKKIMAISMADILSLSITSCFSSSSAQADSTPATTDDTSAVDAPVFLSVYARDGECNCSTWMALLSRKVVLMDYSSLDMALSLNIWMKSTTLLLKVTKTCLNIC